LVGVGEGDGDTPIILGWKVTLLQLGTCEVPNTELVRVLVWVTVYGNVVLICLKLFWLAR
jgi:hypothetical protein